MSQQEPPSNGERPQYGMLYGEVPGSSWTPPSPPVQPPSGQQPSEARRRRRGPIITAGLCVGTLLLAGLGFQLTRPIVVALPASATPATATPTAPEPKLYSMKSRFEYTEASNRINTLKRDLESVIKDGQIGHYVPQTPAGKLHVSAYRQILLTEEQNLKAVADYSSDDVLILTTLAGKARQHAEAVEKRFYDGDSLGVKTSVKDPTTGKMTAYAGTFSPQAEWARIEKALADHVSQPDPATGSYEADSRQLAALAGMSISTDLGVLSKSCGGLKTADDQARVIGVFCSLMPTTVFLNDKSQNWGYTIYNRYLSDAVRHEIAHARISQICQTTRPVITGKKTEGVTSSYAVQFLGADRDTLAQADGEDYAMDELTESIARKIHAGECT